MLIYFNPLGILSSLITDSFLIPEKYFSGKYLVIEICTLCIIISPVKNIYTSLVKIGRKSCLRNIVVAVVRNEISRISIGRTELLAFVNQNADFVQQKIVEIITKRTNRYILIALIAAMSVFMKKISGFFMNIFLLTLVLIAGVMILAF